jgi:small-conductance mechanosensitive channel
MIYLWDSIIKRAYGQEEIDVGIGNRDDDGGGVLEPPTDEQSSPSAQPVTGAETINGIGNYWDSIVFFIMVVAVSVTAYFVIRYFLQKSADSLNLDRRQMKGILSITKMIIIVISSIAIIFHFSSLSGTAAGAISVAAGTIIGFSSRNTISNAIAGILLLSARPFKLGDRIRTTEDESLIGDVVEITLLYTKIKTVRSELVSIPNQTLLQRQIVNYSGLEVLSITVNVSLTYNNNRRLIERLLTESAKSTEGIVTSESFPNEIQNTSKKSRDNSATDPFVLLVKFGDYGAVYDLRAYTNKPREFLKIASEIRKRIYDSFQSHGVDLTVPQAQIGISNTENNSVNDIDSGIDR